MILTWRHNWGHASMDSVCWKWKQECICILSLLKRLKTHLVKHWFMWEWINIFMFLHWFYSIHFRNISNFVWNLILHLWKYVQYQQTNNDILSSLTVKVALDVGKWMTCIVTDMIVESWVWSPWDKFDHGIAFSWYTSLNSVCWKSKDACIHLPATR